MAEKRLCFSSLLLAVALLALCGPLTILLPAAIAGATAFPWSKARTWLALLVGYYIGVHMLIIAEDRFHLALVPFMASLAGPEYFRNKWHKIGVAALIALAWANWGYELVRDWPLLVKLFSEAGHLAGFSY